VVREYQVHLVEDRKLAPSSISIAVSALRFLYKVTLRQPWAVDDIPMPKKPFRLPVVLSPEEVTHFLESVHRTKHRAILMSSARLPAVLPRPNGAHRVVPARRATARAPAGPTP